MDRVIVDVLGNIISIVIGVILAIYHKSLGIKAAYYNQRFLKLFHIQIEFSEETIKGIQIMFLIIGISFIIFGILAIFQIIKLK